MTNSTEENQQKFPLEVLLPKKPTQQEDFLKKYPTYDGRDVLIAILDTGVDPALPGLQITTTGERKVIDCIDCSGAGDVDTSAVRPVADGVITGLTGRKLKIPADWVNPSGKYHVGVKPIFELYDKGLRNRMKKQRKEEVFDPSHQMTTADSLRSMTKHEDALGGYSDQVAEKMEREDLACKIDFLRSVEKMEDRGPIADCLVWNDGTQWKACVDTSFRGRLNLCKPMGNFRLTGEYGKLTDKDEATYTFRIDQNGNWLEIVVCNGSHGTHVANIAAAHFPDEPAKNGLAPGAKILSLTIGDNRIDAMETGTGLTRAFNYCAEYGIHVANMSFGEGTHLPNHGRVIDELKWLIENKKVIFVSSAGNNGPALTTVGAPGGTTSGVLGIGAYLTPEMADPLYGVFNPVEGNLYPWSSRGPAADGWLGVSLCAPGAALTGVPKSAHHGTQMMNGTSMSSPNAAGAIACFLSGLKSKGLAWTPYEVQLALENTATNTNNLEKFSQGQGLVQIDDAFEYFKSMSGKFPETLSRFDVAVAQGARVMRGVYLREVTETDQPQEFNVFVQPKFIEFSEPNAKIDFEKHLILKCNANWVKAPTTFVTTSQQRSFMIEVDPTKITPGLVGYTEIEAFDSGNESMGPLFRVPVTVIRPLPVNEATYSSEFNFDAPSGDPVRHFLAVPPEATAVEVTVKNLSDSISDRFMFHKAQLLDDLCYRNAESTKVLGPDDKEWKHVLDVKGGRTVELCLARAWSRGTKPAKIRMNVVFHGIQKQKELSIVHDQGSSVVRCEVAPFRPVKVNPQVSFNTFVAPIKPTSARLEPLGPRDVFGPGIQIHRLLLTYKINLSKTADIRLELPGLSDYLYESPIDCLRFQVFTATKELVGNASTYPDRYTIKLDKGEYTVQAQLRHPKDTVLERFKDVPLHLNVKISPEVLLDCYKNPEGSILGNGAKWSAKVMDPCQQVTVYLGSLADDKLPKVTNITSGCFLRGDLKIFSDSNFNKVDKTPVNYFITEYSTRAAKGLSMITLKEKEGPKDMKKEMEDAIRDQRISYLEKITDETHRNELYTKLLNQYPTHLPLLLAKLRILGSKKDRSSTESETLDLLIQQILEVCRPNEVLQYLGSRHDYDEQEFQLKKSMDERKSAVIEALIARATFLLDEHLKTSTLDIPTIFKTTLVGVSDLKKAEETEKKENKDNTEAATSDAAADKENGAKKASRPDADAAYAEVLKWIAVDDSKVLLLSAKHAIAHDHKGRALKYLQKQFDEGKGSGKDTKLTEQAICEVCDRLGWVHISNQLRNDTIIRHMEKFRPFQAI